MTARAAAAGSGLAALLVGGLLLAPLPAAAAVPTTTVPLEAVEPPPSATPLPPTAEAQNPLPPESQPANHPAKLDPADDPDFVALSSKPDSEKTIWLNFNGGTLVNSVWNYNRADETNDPIVYRGSEHDDSIARRTEIFDRIAEIYAPFDVDVTTVYPGADALNRTGPDDPEYGLTAVLTDSTLEEMGIPGLAGHPGLAQYNSFGDPYRNIFFIISSEIFDTRTMATDLAHDAGHTFGLVHSGWARNGEIVDEYYTPYSGIWGALMGSVASVPLARWSDNDYPNASHPAQDDLAVITDQAAASAQQGSLHVAETGWILPSEHWMCQDDGLYWVADRLADGGYADCSDYMPSKRVEYVDYYNGLLDFRTDDVSDSAADATPIPLTDDQGSAAGIVSTNDDRDAYSVTVPAGILNLHAEPAAIGANLDILLTLTDAAGTVVQTVDPPDSVGGTYLAPTLVGADAETSLRVPAGTYTVTIEGTGFGDMSQTTRDAAPAAPRYGSLGQYTLAVEVTPDVTPTPTPAPTPAPTPGPGPVPPAPQPPVPGGSTLAATGADPAASGLTATAGALAILAGILVWRRVRRPRPTGD